MAVQLPLQRWDVHASGSRSMHSTGTADGAECNQPFYSGDRGGRAALASRAAVRVRDRKVESAFEKAPRHSGSIEQVADIGPAHLDLIRGRADVTQRIRVVDDCG